MSARSLPRGRARLADLCAAEWIKLWSLRSTPTVLGLVVILALYLAGRDSTHAALLPAVLTGPAGPDHAAFDGPSWMPAMIGTGMVGAESVAGEHVSGLIRATLVAVPDRRRVVAAKAAVIAGVTAVAGVLIAVGGLILAFVIAPGDHRGRSLTDATALHAIGASALVLPVCALAGMAVGAVLRNAAATGFTVCTLLGFGPLLVRPDGNRLATDVANAMPYYAWGRLTSAGRGSSGTMAAGVAWCTLAAWAVLSVIVTAVVIDRRDV